MGYVTENVFIENGLDQFFLWIVFAVVNFGVNIDLQLCSGKISRMRKAHSSTFYVEDCCSKTFKN